MVAERFETVHSGLVQMCHSKDKYTKGLIGVISNYSKPATRNPVQFRLCRAVQSSRKKPQAGETGHSTKKT